MMIPLRIRKAEVALNDGRLDEAYQQAVQADIRDHRKGQKLVGRLQRAYEKRAKTHLSSGNPMAAMADADRAYRLGGNQPQIVALRDEVRQQLESTENAKRSRNLKLAAARRCLASGDYSLGSKLCKDVDDGQTVHALMQDAELNRRLVATAIERGTKALKSSQWQVAFDALDEAKRIQPSGVGVADLADSLCQAVVKDVRSRIDNGRLDQADLLLNRAKQHAPQDIDVQELSRVIAQCREASVSSRSLNVAEMVANLKSLKQIIPSARWLNDAIKDAESVARSVENLRTGPLGSLLPIAATQSTIVKQATGQAHLKGQPQVSGEGPMRIFEATAAVPSRFLIHLDGTGSVLVVRHPIVSVGNASRSQPVDVLVQGQVGMPNMTVERLEDDYFLTATEPVHINSTKTAKKLLTGGDQIRIGRRGSMQFSLPNAASTSATLDFAGVRLANGNARRVILMDDAIVIGPQPSAHIQSFSLERAMVIHWRDGELRLRPMSRAMDAPGATLEMDRPHDVDGLSLVVTQVS